MLVFQAPVLGLLAPVGNPRQGDARGPRVTPTEENLTSARTHRHRLRASQRCSVVRTARLLTALGVNGQSQTTPMSSFGLGFSRTWKSQNGVPNGACVGVLDCRLDVGPTGIGRSSRTIRPQAKGLQQYYEW